MLNVGEIYYLCDQFGPKFIKIIMIGDIWKKDENWVYFYKSTCLDNIISASYTDTDTNSPWCEKAQVKKWNLEKLIDKFTFHVDFKGCIKITDDIIKDVICKNKIDTRKFPYMRYDEVSKYSCNLSSMPKVICSRISKEDFRNMKLDRILE